MKLTMSLRTLQSASRSRTNGLACDQIACCINANNGDRHLNGYWEWEGTKHAGAIGVIEA